MGKQFEALSDAHRDFIAAQHMFFCGTAAAEGRVNISPKGMDSLRVLGPNRIVWLNMTGSGNETAGHLARDPRMTLMWCSFDKRPQILRTYGRARTLHRDAADWDDMIARFGDRLGARQIYDLSIDMVQTSCGYSIPFMDFTGERDTLTRWGEDRGAEGIRDYWASRNRETIDGLPTGIDANLT
ncbi:MAG: pyridoxamine 5'-phosphate oxidase family protein [Marinovum algicola]|uniref:Pyridoxamine 5'-phosphate oxidase n=1 Tax=Marinovum algicola TaxID=42444 RepID=A0A975WBG7_9RHOB|nr:MULTISPECIES: pyridoxamine 5'-phosphate oxidase family protein [Marinovum]MDD9744464.1 pyridoxamine 5'-phosphate oxidase family protein [Marinovum sp. PR37]SEJ76739.1 Pyridoxamine 5'-phosphate oxidase [Marinovum algicola]SLN60359.1 Pyridoxamine 5'-phosphate oxidase [Marinovum algicola]